MNLKLKEELESTIQQVQNLRNSEKTYQLAFNDMRNDYQRLLSKEREFEALSRQREQDLNELNQEVALISEDNVRLKASLSSFNNRIDNTSQEKSDLEERVRTAERRSEELQNKLAKKLEDIQGLNERYNTAQLRYFTINQEYETLKQNTTREITMLQNSLRSLTQQNKILMKVKIELEDEIKRNKDSEHNQTNKLEKELKDYKMLTETLEETNKMLQNGRFQTHSEFTSYVGKCKENLSNNQAKEEINVSGDISMLKHRLTESYQLCNRLRSQNEQMLKNYDREMKIIKTQYMKLDRAFKLSQQTFALKQGEFEKLKDEYKIRTIEKNSVVGDLKNSRILNERLNLDLGAIEKELDKEREITQKLSNENSSLSNQIAALMHPKESEDSASNSHLQTLINENNTLKQSLERLTISDSQKQTALVAAISKARSLAEKHKETLVEESLEIGKAIDIDLVKKELLSLLNNLRNIKWITTDCLVDGIYNQEDFQNVHGIIMRVLDEIMVVGLR